MIPGIIDKFNTVNVIMYGIEFSVHTATIHVLQGLFKSMAEGHAEMYQQYCQEPLQDWFCASLYARKEVFGGISNAVDKVGGAAACVLLLHVLGAAVTLGKRKFTKIEG